MLLISTLTFHSIDSIPYLIIPHYSQNQGMKHFQSSSEAFFKISLGDAPNLPHDYICLIQSFL